MAGRICLLASAAIVLVFASLHLLHTFWGKGLKPRDATVQAAMDATSIGLTNATTVWRAWIGFNASHGLGMLLFAAVYGYFALQPEGGSKPGGFLLGVGLAVLTAQLVLAWQYWFRIPLIGVAVAWALFAAALVLR